MSQENVEIVKSVYDGYRERGIDGLLEPFDDSLEYFPIEEAEAVRGRDGFRRYFDRWLDAWEGRVVRVDATEYLDGGDYVVAREVHEGRGIHSEMDISMVIWSVSCVRDGKIVHREEFLSRAEALEAVGLSG
jgi:ketosteroid isomerase-like protein